MLYYLFYLLQEFDGERGREMEFGEKIENTLIFLEHCELFF